MGRGGENTVSEVTPNEAWSALEQDPTAQLVDVRTRPEWSFVGVPDLSPLNRQAILIEWRAFPSMQVNPDFTAQLEAALGDIAPEKLYFLCRSGARSMEAARAISEAFAATDRTVACINVAEGFEGDLDAERHRGRQNGWKARGLTWIQS